VFTDNAVYVFEDGREAVRCTRADGLGLERLAASGVITAIVSTERNPVVSARAKKLRMRCVQDCPDKVAALTSIAAEHGLGLDRAAFVGNDVNDAACLRAVALPIVVADAHPDILPAARYQTRAAGGHGAVREICDLFVQVRAGAGAAVR
jgi:N-acylneuraminate cytidylyltransferase/3-deoxy-D-manno-octulosonate 8-phosphate phosphatase (KDO 8-P phosphatase)